MRITFTLIFFIFFTSVALAQSAALDNLKDELNKKAVYDKQKETTIKVLKQKLAVTSKKDLQRQFDLSLKLYDEYKSYQYDSAYVYAGKLQELSVLLKSPSKAYYSKIKIGFILLSSGMFKETFDSLKGINVASLDDSVKFEYYSLLTRAYYDVAGYDNDHHYTPYYADLANKCIDSAIALTKPDSYDKIYLTGYKKLKNGNLQSAEADFNELINHQS